MLCGGQEPYFAKLMHIVDAYLAPISTLCWADNGLRYFEQLGVRSRFMAKNLGRTGKEAISIRLGARAR